MKRISIGLLIFFAAIATLFRWAYSENAAKDDATILENSKTLQTERLEAAKPVAAPSASNSEQSIDNVTTGLSLDELKHRSKDIAACLRLKNQKRIANSLLSQPTESLDEYARHRLDQNLEMVNAQITKSQNDGACAGLNADLLTGTIYPLLLDMAQQGDDEAADCYVAADFEISNAQMTPDQTQAYRQNAASLVRAQIEKGDWRMVELMEAAYDRDGDPHRGRYSWFREISSGNPASAYGYNRLLRFGATDDYGRRLDLALDARKAELTPAQVAEQDAWAQKEYEAHFSVSAPVGERIPTCAMYSDNRVYHNVKR